MDSSECIRARPLMVNWHQNQGPIYSADFQPNGDRLATGGSDYTVRIWRLQRKDGEATGVEYLSTLTEHAFTVNAVRFDPKGKILASADDDGVLILWELSDNKITAFGEEEEKQYDVESWKVRRKIKMFTNEIYDIAWSPDSKYIIAGSMQNVAGIVDVSTGTVIRELAEHSGIVQGVAWDPLNEYIATQSSDRAVHIYNLINKEGKSVLNEDTHCTLSPFKIDKTELPKDAASPSITSGGNGTSTSVQNSDNTNAATTTTTSSAVVQSPSTVSTPKSNMDPPPPVSASRTHSRKSSFTSSSNRSESPIPSGPTGHISMPLPAVRSFGSPSISQRGQMSYSNESASAFFRRLTFTPDGSLLLTPTGLFKQNNTDPAVCTVYIYSRKGLNRPPVAHLPGLKNPSLAVRCSPVFYKLREAIKTRHIAIDPSQKEAVQPLPESLDDDASSESDKNSHLGKTPTSKQNQAPVFKLQYRMVYAVATKDSVIVYDTQQPTPICIVSNLSYLEFTDLAWSRDGSTLLVTSTDGFCSVISFMKGALGEKMDPKIVKECIDLVSAGSSLTSATSGTSGTTNSTVAGGLSSPSASSSSAMTESASKESNEPQNLTPVVSHVPPAGLHNNSIGKYYRSQQQSPEKRSASESEDGKKKRRIAPQLVSNIPSPSPASSNSNGNNN